MCSTFSLERSVALLQGSQGETIRVYLVCIYIRRSQYLKWDAISERESKGRGVGKNAVFESTLFALLYPMTFTLLGELTYTHTHIHIIIRALPF